MENHVQFHEQLQRIRRQLGLSQRQLGRLFGVDERTIRRWEQGEASPTISMHTTIAKALGKSLEELGLYPFHEEQTASESEKVHLLNPLRHPSYGDQTPHLSIAGSPVTDTIDATMQKEMSRQQIKAVLQANAFVDHRELFGVDAVLERIREHLVSEQSSWIISIFGEGGLGKTALAYEAVTRYAVDAGFTRLAWVSAKTVQILPDGTLLRSSSAELRWSDIVKKIADQLGLAIGESSLGWIPNFQQALHALPPSEKCLLVVDNLETVEDVSEAIHYLCGPDVGRYMFKPHKILITTRYTLAGRAFHVMEQQLKGLHHSDALRFIRESGNDEMRQASGEELMPVVEATEGNPLLIKLCIMRFLASYQSLAFILAELQAANKFFGKNIIEYLYAESLSLLQQRCGEQVANQMLNAFCPLSAGEVIDAAQLLRYSGIANMQAFENALRTACELSLIRSSRLNRSYSIHSLLWKFVCYIDDQR